MSEELDRWDFEIAEGMKEHKMTGYVYDDKAPNGRAAVPEQIRNLPLTDFELELQIRLDRIENLLVTVLGHVEPMRLHGEPMPKIIGVTAQDIQRAIDSVQEPTS